MPPRVARLSSLPFDHPLPIPQNRRTERTRRTRLAKAKSQAVLRVLTVLTFPRVERDRKRTDLAMLPVLRLHVGVGGMRRRAGRRFRCLCPGIAPGDELFGRSGVTNEVLDNLGRGNGHYLVAAGRENLRRHPHRIDARAPLPSKGRVYGYDLFGKRRRDTIAYTADCVKPQPLSDLTVAETHLSHGVAADVERADLALFVGRVGMSRLPIL